MQWREANLCLWYANRHIIAYCSDLNLLDIYEEFWKIMNIINVCIIHVKQQATENTKLKTDFFKCIEWIVLQIIILQGNIQANIK